MKKKTNRLKTEGFQISHYYWLFSSDIVAVKGLKLTSLDNRVGALPTHIKHSPVHKRKDCVVLFLPLSLSVYQPQQQSVIIDSVATELRVAQSFNKRCSMNEENRKMDGT